MSAVKRKPSHEFAVENEADILRITPLGAGQEVGRSCIVLEYKNKTIMLDCGLHPAYDGEASLPFIDEIDPASVDLLLVTHFHVDHAAAVPYYLEKTNFRGRTFMTHPTKAIFRWLVSDYVKVSNSGAASQHSLYEEEDMLRAYNKIEAINYRQQVEVNGVKFTAFNAGHVLGAAMFVIEIAGVKVLYTGDYSREEDRHLMAAENPGVPIDVLITESTYGTQSHEPRPERERRFTRLVHGVVKRGGRCLMPVFALGRTQELLLILDEYWSKHPEVESVPIYFASSLAKRCMAVFQTYIHMMNDHIKKQFQKSNPFRFKHISNIKNLNSFDDNGPCVMVASPGMLQSGLSRELFDKWAPDRRNGLVITGYSVEGTLARSIMNEPDEVETLAGVRIPRRMSVDYISFSAHVDGIQNSEFIEEINAPNLILVHGEKNAMGQLRAALQRKFAESSTNMKIYTPANIEPVELHFRGEKMVKVYGGKSYKVPEDGDLISGVLVHKDFKYTLIDPTDLNDIIDDLAPTSIMQSQVVPYRATFSLLMHYLEQMYGVVEEVLEDGEPVPSTKETSGSNDNGGDGKERDSAATAIKDGSANKGVRTVRVYDSIDVHYIEGSDFIELEWESDVVNDMIADSIIALVLNIECSPASVKLTKSSCQHGYSSVECVQATRTPSYDDIGTKRERLLGFLSQQFTQLELSEDKLSIIVTLDNKNAAIDLHSLTVTSDYDLLKSRLETILARFVHTQRPIVRKLSRGAGRQYDLIEKAQEPEESGPDRDQERKESDPSTATAATEPAAQAQTGSEVAPVA